MENSNIRCPIREGALSHLNNKSKYDPLTIGLFLNWPHTIESYFVHSLFQNPVALVKRGHFRMSCKHEVLGSYNDLLCLLDIHQCYVTLWNPSTRIKSKRFPISVGRDEAITYHDFGYDHMNNKYKVLVVVDDPGETVTKVYTFGAKSWKVVQVILSFDLGTERCGQVLMPDRDGDNVFNPMIDVSRKCLCICFFDNQEAHWVVWLMKEYGLQHS